MKKTFSRYNRILAAILLPVIAALLVTSSQIEPLSGNMTRIGGYLESDYGWNKEQLEFVRPQFTKDTRTYDHYSDVVVLGDSFTKDTQWGWANYFVRDSGLSLQFFHFSDGDYRRIIDSKTFAHDPPRLLIVESVEAELKNRFGAVATSCPPPAVQPSAQLPILPRQAQTRTVSRDTATSIANLDLAADYLGKALPRFFGMETTDTLRVQLTRGDLFSSSKSNYIIAYNHALKLRNWGPEIIENIRCNLLALQKQVVANGKTRFLFMPVPTKLYAYSAYIKDQRFSTLSITRKLAEHPAPNILRLDQFITQKIADGHVDFYLPNDTHWSSDGYRQVADYLLSSLLDHRLPQETP